MATHCIIITRVAPLGLSGHHESVLRSPSSIRRRSRQGRRDPRAAPPDHRPGAPTRRPEGEVHPRGSNLPLRTPGLVAPPGAAPAARRYGRTPSCAGTATCSADATRPSPGTSALDARAPCVPSGLCVASGQGEPDLGLSPHPRRTRRSGSQGCRLYRVGDPQDRGHRSRTRPGLQQLGRLPALPGSRAPGLRLHRDHYAERSAPVHPCCHRARDSPRPHPRHHRPPHRGLGRSARPQPGHGPRRRRRGDRVPDPGQGHQVSRPVRPDPHRRRHHRPSSPAFAHPG